MFDPKTDNKYRVLLNRAHSAALAHVRRIGASAVCGLVRISSDAKTRVAERIKHRITPPILIALLVDTNPTGIPVVG